MPLEDIVNLSITAETTTPTKPGFGVPLILANGVPAGFTSRTQAYASTKEMTDAGFAVTHPAYKAAQAIFSQNPRPKKIKIGRRALAPTQAFTLKCLSAVEGAVYKITFAGTPITYTVGASATTTTVAAAIELLLEAVDGANSEFSASSDTITFTNGVAGTYEDVSGLSDNFVFTNTTTDPGLATDLAAIFAEDPDWYGLTAIAPSKAECQAIAAWAEANGKLAILNTLDGGVLDNTVTTDVASVLKASAYARSGVLFSGQLLSHSAAAWFGEGFPWPPGSSTWKFKTLAGIPADNLSAGKQANAKAKNCNTYVPVEGVNITQEGVTASGEFIDVTHGLDWLRAEIKFRVFSKFVNERKTPYTDAGVTSVLSVIDGALKDAVRATILAADPAPVSSAPKVSEIDPTVRATRLLPDISLSGRLAGAVHASDITGTVSA
jgi:hypothetical protein